MPTPVINQLITGIDGAIYWVVVNNPTCLQNHSTQSLSNKADTGQSPAPNLFHSCGCWVKIINSMLTKKRMKDLLDGKVKL